MQAAAVFNGLPRELHETMQLDIGSSFVRLKSRTIKKDREGVPTVPFVRKSSLWQRWH